MKARINIQTRREVCAHRARACFKIISVVFAPRRAHSGLRPSMTWKKCTSYIFSARTLVFRGSVSFFRPFLPCQPPYTSEVGGSIRQLKMLANFALPRYAGGRKGVQSNLGRNPTSVYSSRPSDSHHLTYLYMESEAPFNLMTATKSKLHCNQVAVSLLMVSIVVQISK